MPPDPHHAARWIRSPEALALFNPVLTSELILTACYWREQEDRGGIDWRLFGL